MCRDQDLFCMTSVWTCIAFAGVLAFICAGKPPKRSTNAGLNHCLCVQVSTFLFRELLERNLALEGVVRARTKRRMPEVMTIEEGRDVLDRQGKGGKDRCTMLPSTVGEKLQAHLEEVRR